MTDLEAMIKYSHVHKARITVEFDNGVVYIYENGKVIRGAKENVNVHIKAELEKEESK